MKKEEITVTITKEAKEDQLLLKFSFVPTDKSATLPFRFNNSGRRFERNRILILDDKNEALEQVGFKYLNTPPKEDIQTIISKKEPFIVSISATVQDNNEKILLDLFSAQYLLEKEKEYLITLRDSHLNIIPLKIVF